MVQFEVQFVEEGAVQPGSLQQIALDMIDLDNKDWVGDTLWINVGCFSRSVLKCEAKRKYIWYIIEI